MGYSDIGIIDTASSVATDVIQIVRPPVLGAGIALAAIKELYKQNQELHADNKDLRRRVERLEGR